MDRREDTGAPLGIAAVLMSACIDDERRSQKPHKNFLGQEFSFAQARSAAEMACVPGGPDGREPQIRPDQKTAGIRLSLVVVETEQKSA